jgi:hypothetical protein
MAIIPADPDRIKPETVPYVEDPLRTCIENRRAEYPTIQEIAVALADKAEGDSTMWDKITAQRLAAKAKYPKPTA